MLNYVCGPPYYVSANTEVTVGRATASTHKPDRPYVPNEILGIYFEVLVPRQDPLSDDPTIFGRFNFILFSVLFAYFGQIASKVMVSELLFFAFFCGAKFCNVLTQSIYVYIS